MELTLEQQMQLAVVNGNFAGLKSLLVSKRPPETVARGLNRYIDGAGLSQQKTHDMRKIVEAYLFGQLNLKESKPARPGKGKHPERNAARHAAKWC